MTVTEVALVVIAIAAACTGAAAVITALRLGAVSRQLEPLLADARATLRRVDAIAGELELVVRDARRLEGRLNTVVEGPLRAAAALVQGLGAGLTSLIFRRSHRDAPSPPNDGPGVEGMITKTGPAQAEGGRR